MVAEAALIRPYRRRRLRAIALALIIGAGLLTSPLVLIAVAEPEGSPAHPPWEWAEEQVRRDEQLHRNIHLALGKVFSVCRCTAELSASQYRKASFHGPSRTTR